MDRCPYCRSALYFEGIAPHPVWLRWLSCHRCGRFVAHDQHGNIHSFGMAQPTGIPKLRYTKEEK